MKPWIRSVVSGLRRVVAEAGGLVRWNGSASVCHVPPSTRSPWSRRIRQFRSVSTGWIRARWNRLRTAPPGVFRSSPGKIGFQRSHDGPGLRSGDQCRSTPNMKSRPKPGRDRSNTSFSTSSQTADDRSERLPAPTAGFPEPMVQPGSLSADAGGSPPLDPATTF